MNKPKRLLWLYIGDHARHPFIPTAARSLVEAGYNVTIIDSGLPHIESHYRHITIPQKMKIFRNFALYSISNKYGYSKYGLPLILARTMTLRPWVIIASHPMQMLVGRIISIFTGARLVYYPYELYAEQIIPVPGMMKKLEVKAVSRWIDAMITQNEERARVYLDERHSRVKPAIVHNYKPRKKITGSGKLRNLLHLPPECRIILYEGIVYDGRDLEQLVKSAAYLPEDSRLVLMGQREEKWWQKAIAPLLNDPAIYRKVLAADWVPHEEIMEYTADADAGIIIYSNGTRNNRFCEPGKLSDYIFAGVPVVAPDFPTIGPVIRQYGLGETFKNTEPAEIARAINKVLAIPKNNWRAALDKAAEELSWETQVSTFLKAVAGEKN